VWFIGCLCVECECAVVYLDADTIVVRNIDDLFKCGKFCANLKHSERLNSGVMVVEPSATLFNDMMSKIKTTASYTGGKTNFGYFYILLLWFYLFIYFLFYFVLFIFLFQGPYMLDVDLNLIAFNNGLHLSFSL